MGTDRVVVVAGGGRRRPRPLRAGLHAGVLIALVAGSGAVAGHRPAPVRHERPAADAQPRHVPQYLHRFHECCAGSSDPSMEVY